MKSFTKHLAALFVLLSTLSSCDVEKIIDDNFKEKSLVVVAPDFIKNRVTVVFEDAETGEIIDEDLDVSVVSSKKIIDLSGHYKNTFEVKNGMLQFAVDPNEVVSKEDPLYIKFNSRKVFISNKVLKGDKEKMLLRIPVSSFEIQLNLDNKQGKFIQETLRARDFFELRFNDSSYIEFNSKFYNPKYFSTDGFFLADQVGNNIDLTENFPSAPNFVMVGFDGIAWPLVDFMYDYSKENYFKKIENDLVISVIESKNDAFSNLENYMLAVIYQPPSLSTGVIKVFLHKDGKLTQDYYKDELGIGFFTHLIKTKDQYPGPNLKSLQIPAGSTLWAAWFEFWPKDSNIIQCKEGFNFNFEGLSSEDRPNLLYKTVRNNGLNSYVGYANPTSVNSTHNTTALVESHTYGKHSNKVVFAENSQYLISPQEMDLGGEEACGKTFDFKVFPKEGLEKYKLNLQFQCPGDDYSTAPSVSARFNKVGDGIPSEIITLENGSANLYLEENRFYKVSGSFNDSEFDFTFTNNQSEIQEAIRRTLAENKNLLNIYYFQREVKDEDGNFLYNLINAIVTFKEGGCPE